MKTEKLYPNVVHLQLQKIFNVHSEFQLTPGRAEVHRNTGKAWFPIKHKYLQ